MPLPLLTVSATESAIDDQLIALDELKRHSFLIGHIQYLERFNDTRAFADFDRPYAGQTSADNLLNYAAQGGFMPAVQNLFAAGNPLVQAIATHWGEWRDGVPQR